ncbi:glutamine synthetase [Candidatus Woesearchaeota archaeon]|nr:glutamine synthetase [Candidatus Woesearchaeota archaeon]
MDKEKLLEKVKKDNIKFVNLQFSDMMGIVKSVTIPVADLKEAVTKGVWFDGSSVEGYMRVHESDMYLMPDIKTYSVIPWFSSDEIKTARLICDVYMPDGKPFKGDPRHILKKVLKEAKEMGYIFNVGPEPEFFLFKRENGIKTLTHDVGGYFDLSMDRAFEIRAKMTNALEKFGIKVETSHHEVAPGQHEIDFQYTDALTAADNVITFKFTLKAIANKYNLHATFMPKPIAGINGSGMHVHQSLADINTGKNKFFDPENEYKLSKLARHFVEGQLKNVKGMSAVLSPLVNSYKRLVPGYEAPAYVCWARVNRSALIRIPGIPKGRGQSARAELRCPDPSCNPYIAFAVMLKAGLMGIKKEMKLRGPVEEDVYEFDDDKLRQHYIEMLPGSLYEAIEEMKRSEVVKKTLGEETFNKYLNTKKAEWDNYRLKVHQWEIDKYLTLY